MKSFGVAAVVFVGLASLPCLGVGCGGDDSETAAATGAGGGTSVSSSHSVSSSTGGPTSSSTGSGSDVPACYDESTAFVAPGTISEAGVGKCTAAQVDELFTCLFTMDPDPTICDKYTMDTAMGPERDCFNCVLPVDMDGNSNKASPVLLCATSLCWLNTGACEAVAQGKPECGPSASQVTWCPESACDICDTTTAEIQDCLDYSSVNPPCSDVMITADCKTVLSKDSPECKVADFKTGFATIANYMCGPGGGTGGAGGAGVGGAGGASTGGAGGAGGN